MKKKKIYCLLCKILLWESEIAPIDYCDECLGHMDGRASDKVCQMCLIVSKDGNFFFKCEDCTERRRKDLRAKTRKT